MTTKDVTSIYAPQRAADGLFKMNPTIWVTTLSRALARWKVFAQLAALYSILFEVKVEALQAVYYFYAQVFCLLFFLPFAYGGGWRMCLFVLFVLSAKAAMRHDFDEDR